MLAFAWHSRHRVATELEHEASRRLHEYAKTAGILLTERLILATGELRLVALQGRKEGRRTPSRVEPLLRVVPAEQIGFDDARFVFDLTRPAGALLKVHRESPGEPPSLWLVTQVSTNGSMFAGEIDPKYLFQSEGLERPPTVLDVHLPDGTLVHSSHEGVLAQEVLHRVGLGRRARGEFSWEAEGETRVGHYREIFLAPQFGQNLVVTVHDTRASIHAPIATFEHDIALIALLTAASAALVSLVRIRKMTAPVHALEEASERLAHRDFDVHIEAKHSGELSSVIDAFNEMAANLKRRTEIMDAVNAFGASLARETDPELVIEKLVEGAETMFGVDGILVHRTGNEETLDAVRLRIRSMGLDLRSGEEELEWVGSVNPSAVTSEASVTRSISSSRSRVLRGLRVFATRLSYELLEVVELPLFAEEDEVFGVITLFNARDEHGDPSWFDEERLELASSLAGQVSAALSNVQLRTEFKALFDALIEMLAVDEKSPYTGGHCRRVPDLAMRIFEAVHAEEEGGFRDVQFDEYEAYEMQVASLLHDCGKVVTPVHVMDKSTKLETIWDRIELVDQRFSLVAKALEVEALRAVLQDAGVDVGPVMERAGRWLDSLRLDREFLRRARRRSPPQHRIGLAVDRLGRRGPPLPHGGRGPEPLDSQGDPHARRAPRHQSSHGRDDQDAGGPAVPSAFAQRSTHRRKPPRTSRWEGVPQGAHGSRDSPSGEDARHCRRLRGVDGHRSSVQEGHAPVAISRDHAEHGERWAHRPRLVRPLRAFGGLEAVR